MGVGGTPGIVPDYIAYAVKLKFVGMRSACMLRSDRFVCRRSVCVPWVLHAFTSGDADENVGMLGRVTHDERVRSRWGDPELR